MREGQIATLVAGHWLLVIGYSRYRVYQQLITNNQLLVIAISPRECRS